MKSIVDSVVVPSLLADDCILLSSSSLACDCGFEEVEELLEVVAATGLESLGCRLAPAVARTPVKTKSPASPNTGVLR